MSAITPSLLAAASEGPPAAVLTEIRDALRGLSFGHVSITVQDGVVVQVERVERRRVFKPRRPDAG